MAFFANALAFVDPAVLEALLGNLLAQTLLVSKKTGLALKTIGVGDSNLAILIQFRPTKFSDFAVENFQMHILHVFKDQVVVGNEFEDVGVRVVVEFLGARVTVVVIEGHTISTARHGIARSTISANNRPARTNQTNFTTVGHVSFAVLNGHEHLTTATIL